MMSKNDIKLINEKIKDMSPEELKIFRNSFDPDDMDNDDAVEFNGEEEDV